MDVLSVERFFQIQKRSQAFSMKDIQTMAVMVQWFQSVGVTLQEMAAYAVMAPRVLELFSLGYFDPAPSPEQLKQIRRVEASLPKEARKMWRKARLNNSWSGSIRPRE